MKGRLTKSLQLLVLVLAVIVLTNCTTEDVTPKADFTLQGQTVSDFALGTYDECLLEVQASNIKSVEWDFGDGNSSNALSINYSFNKSGTYVVSLTVIHQSGVKSVVKKSVVVKDRVLKSIGISKVYWEQNVNGWPTTPHASIYLKIQEYTNAEMTAGYLCATCPLVYTSSVIDNVSSYNLEPISISVNERIVIEKNKIQFAVPENLNNAYLISLIARDSEGNEYCLQSNRGGGTYFGVLREDFSANEFIVQNGPFSDYTLECKFE